MKTIKEQIIKEPNNSKSSMIDTLYSLKNSGIDFLFYIKKLVMYFEK